MIIINNYYRQSLQTMIIKNHNPRYSTLQPAFSVLLMVVMMVVVMVVEVMMMLQVLYLATCLLCPSKPQYGGFTTAMEKTIV